MATTIDLGAVVPIHKGDWSAETLYERANIVRHNSTAWLCKVEQSIGVEPSEDSSDWSLMVKDMSAVTSVNGKRGDVTLDFEHVNTPSLEDSSNRVANTEFINQKLEPVSQQLNSLSEQLNTLDTDSVKGSNVSVLPKANSIPKAGADGKLNSDWISTENLAKKDLSNVSSTVVNSYVDERMPRPQMSGTTLSYSLPDGTVIIPPINIRGATGPQGPAGRNGDRGPVGPQGPAGIAVPQNIATTTLHPLPAGGTWFVWANYTIRGGKDNPDDNYRECYLKPGGYNFEREHGTGHGFRMNNLIGIRVN